MSAQHSPLIKLEKRRIRASFDAAAEHYDEVAVLQREIGERILDRLDLIKLVQVLVSPPKPSASIIKNHWLSPLI